MGRIPGSNACPDYWKRDPHVVTVPSETQTHFLNDFSNQGCFHLFGKSSDIQSFEVIIAFLAKVVPGYSADAHFSNGRKKC